ncbi:MAG TPA: TAXI family TRAP transporter solute-binding subunit [Methylomirabilota bacterium]|nr:TAXI family TRAP transporter solute-binding subunit [Methylomirabilota bacterium]
MANSCWGIFRESTHSPGRESDDTEILRLTGKHLEAKGFHVELKTADEVTEVDADRPRFVFLMCERTAVLDRLRALEVGGVPHVNSPRAVHNTYRDRMIAVLDEATVPFIPSRIVATSEEPDAEAYPVWVKRGDVHNTQGGDVVLAPTAAAIHDALRELAARGIPRAVLPKGRFRGVTEDVPTFNFSGWCLMARGDLPAEFTYLLAKDLDEHREEIHEIFAGPHASMTSVPDLAQSARELDELRFPLHPGAEQYYRERGYL